MSETYTRVRAFGPADEVEPAMKKLLEADVPLLPGEVLRVRGHRTDEAGKVSLDDEAEAILRLARMGGTAGR